MSSNYFDVIIAGAGLSGLAVAHFLKKLCPEKSILILEKANRVGGAIQSLQEDGYLAEWGPHGFLDNVAETNELMKDLDFRDSVQKASLKKFLRYVCLEGQLKLIPQTPPKIISSDIMSFPSKARVLAELWKKPRTEEQSVAEWIEYRLGKGFLPFADIVMTGTYAGDINKLSVDSVWPGFRHLELTYGSVFRGLLKSRRQKAAKQDPNKPRSFPSMVSFKGGMEQLVSTLAVDKTIELSTGANYIEQTEQGWRVETNSTSYTTENLVLATQINQSLKLLDTIKAAPQTSVEEGIIYNVVLGFDQSAEIPFGFGFLTPKKENRFALGAMFPTHMFPERAPGERKTLEVLVGGTRNPEYLKLPEDELVERAVKDVSELIKLPKPEFIRVLKPNAGIPQLNIGHKKLRDYREQMEVEFSGLNICGFGWEGIGTNDMIKMAKQTALNIKNGGPASRRTPESKKIYV